MKTEPGRTSLDSAVVDGLPQRPGYLFNLTEQDLKKLVGQMLGKMHIRRQISILQMMDL